MDGYEQYIVTFEDGVTDSVLERSHEKAFTQAFSDRSRRGIPMRISGWAASKGVEMRFLGEFDGNDRVFTSPLLPIR